MYIFKKMPNWGRVALWYFLYWENICRVPMIFLLLQLHNWSLKQLITCNRFLQQISVIVARKLTSRKLEEKMQKKDRNKLESILPWGGNRKTLQNAVNWTSNSKKRKQRRDKLENYLHNSYQNTSFSSSFAFFCLWITSDSNPST